MPYINKKEGMLKNIIDKIEPITPYSSIPMYAVIFIGDPGSVATKEKPL